MKKRPALVFILFSLLLPLSILKADVIRVPADSPTIQAGIDAALVGDTVLVAPGVYSGVGNYNLEFFGKAITLVSEAGPEETVIDATGADYGLYLHDNESRQTLISGFSVRHADAGGIYLAVGASPTVINCIFEEQQSTFSHGVSISGSNPAPLFQDCIIRNNVNNTASGGAGIYATGSVTGAVFQNCLISNNQANSSFAKGGGFYSAGASPLFVNCTIVENHAGSDGGGLYAGTLNMRNSIVWGNTSTSGTASIFAKTRNIVYSNIEEIWPDQGNLFADPMFSDTLFHLQTGSPCIDAGDPTDDFSREPLPNGERINMGRYGNTGEATAGVNGEPIILSLSAISGPPEGGIQDTIRGKFLGASAGSITFDGLPAAIIYWSDTLVICTVPAHAAGKVDVSAITAAAKTDVLTYGFTYEGSLSLGVPSDYPTIQQAINVAQAGDTVLVGPGVYSGIGNYNLEFFGKAIALVSEAGPEETIIDATGADYGLYLHDNESRQTLISGFSVQHADGGGIYLAVGASPTVINCIFEEQQSTFSHGVSISGSNPAPLFQDCIIRNNVNNTSSGGAGIYAPGSVTGAVFQNCLISNNQANSSFAKGGGFYSSGASPLFVNCTIVNNHAGGDGGGLYAETLNMRNSIVWDNTSTSGAASIFAKTRNIVYSNIEEIWPDQGNLFADPMFSDTLFHLQTGSPCIDAGDPTDDFSREPLPNGDRVNIGRYGNTGEAAIGVNGEPIILSLSATSGPPEGGIRDSIRGKFLGASTGSITFDGLPAAIAYWSDTLVICTVPAHAAGKVDVSAITAAAKTDVLTYGFTYEGALSLGVPSDYPTIQQAINVAQAGDTVLVAPGVYSGIGNYNLEFFSKAIVLTSEAGAEQTIIDATGADYGLYLHDNESRQTLISGFSVRHADEGGIYLAVGASPTVINCIFEEQQSTFSHGVSISGSNPAPLFQDCIIRNNVNNTSSGGAGIYATGSVTGAIFQNCLISNNQANSSFAKGGGFYSSGASPLFVNCTIVDNHAGSDGGGLYAGTLNMRNSIVWGNTSASGAASIFITGTNAVTYTDVEGGWPGMGNINDDPIFLNPSLGDYHLHPSSPCIDAGDPADDFSREPQPNGGRINMGFYGNTEEATASDLAMIITNVIVTPSCETETTVRIEGLNFGDAMNDGEIILGVEAIVAEKISLWSDTALVFLGSSNLIGQTDLIVQSSTFGSDTIAAQYITPPNIQYVSGEVEGVWTAECPSIYMLTGDVTVPEGKSLTIEPGVSILVNIDSAGRDARFLILDTLNAIGSETDSIIFSVFSPLATPGDWDGLDFASSSRGSLAYCRVEYAKTGIEANSGQVVIEKSTIQHNRDEGVSWLGLAETSASGDLIDCLIRNNGGWGVECYASCGRDSGSASPNIVGNIIQNNAGGGVYVGGVTSNPPPFTPVPANQSASAIPLIKTNTIFDNGGWGVECYARGQWFDATPFDLRFRGNSSPTIVNNLFVNNKGGIKASAPFFDSANSSWLSTSNPQVINNTFWNNDSLDVFAGDSARIEIKNSIFWGSTEGMVQSENGGIVEINYSNFQQLQQGEGNISQDPLFFNPAAGDFRLLATSSCIDVGNNDDINETSDFYGAERIADGNGDENAVVDMGAIEYQAPFFTQQPLNVSICEGESALLSVEVNIEQVDFQWFKDGAPIALAQSNILSIENAAPGDSGEYTCQVMDELGGLISSMPATIAVAMAPCNEALSTSPIIYLQGAYDPVEGLMRDNLRMSALLPLNEPYTGLGYTHLGGGGESVQQTVFDVGGMDAIVDWVFLEVRDKSDFALVRATRSALLQRDGDVVDVDGLSPVSFSNLPADDYYLVVKHRNHLGVMSAAPVALSNTTTIVDFTSDLNDVFGASNGIATLSDGTLGLFSGDFNRNGQVQNTDYNALLETLGTAGYEPGDLDLNSQIQNTDLQLNLIPNIGKGQPFPQ